MIVFKRGYLWGNWNFLLCFSVCFLLKIAYFGFDVKWVLISLLIWFLLALVLILYFFRYNYFLGFWCFWILFLFWGLRLWGGGFESSIGFGVFQCVIFSGWLFYWFFSSNNVKTWAVTFPFEITTYLYALLERAFIELCYDLSNFSLNVKVFVTVIAVHISHYVHKFSRY